MSINVFIELINAEFPFKMQPRRLAMNKHKYAMGLESGRQQMY